MINPSPDGVQLFLDKIRCLVEGHSGEIYADMEGDEVFFRCVRCKEVTLERGSEVGN